MKNVIKKVALAAIAALALTGCFKHEPFGHRTDYDPEGGNGHGGNGGNGQEQINLTERSDWKVRYVAREDWVNDDGTVDRVEHFEFSYTGKTYYIVRMVRPEDFKEAYQSDAAAFFTFEAKSLLEDAKNDGVNFWQYDQEVFDAKITDIYFNRLRSGTWTAFLIELDAKGGVTGNYAETSFTLREEQASDAFSKWLGAWRVSNGLVGYDIDISSIDNNFVYRIDGWEQGPAVSFQMDQEYLEAEFYEPNGFLYIFSQFLGAYDDDNLGTVDELFMGNIYDSNGLTVITDEGLDLAVMVPTGADTAELQPLTVKLETNSGVYETDFYSMQYYMWAHQTGEWHAYNDNAGKIKLPLTMTRLEGTRAASVHYAKAREVTRSSIHHSQPKAGRGSRNSVAKKAVRLK